jgi:hypothetical protein
MITPLASLLFSSGILEMVSFHQSLKHKPPTNGGILSWPFQLKIFSLTIVEK